MLDESERSTLGHNVIKLQRYKSDESKDILTDRAKLAFKPRTVKEEVIELIADVTSKRKINPEDARFALDMLFYSGLIAHAQKCNSVQLEHTRIALGQVIEAITSEDLLSLEEEEILVLLGLARALKATDKPFVTIAEIYEYYLMICEEKGTIPIKTKKFREYINDLIIRELATMSEKGIGIIGTPLIDVEEKLENVLRFKFVP